MDILLVGSGGREHAIARALSRSFKVTKIYTAPGNPGTALLGENVPIADTDLQALLRFAKASRIGLTIVGPEAPLTLGIVDLFRANGLAIVGPSQAAAQLEGSKSFAKAFMQRHHIPTADFQVFSEYEPAIRYLNGVSRFPVVIKADGLAAGKGVTVASSLEEAVEAVRACMVEQRFSDAGHRVVIESFLEGEEASLFAFCDGTTVIPMLPSQDHKRIGDGDQGPNTGGMGAYTPAPLVTDAVSRKVMDRVLLPVLRGMRMEGMPYTGILYAGLMIDSKGEPFVVEFNARFGDPETQTVLPLLKTDLPEILMAVAEARLHDMTVEWASDSAVCVVMAAKGYPGDYEKGAVIYGLDTAEKVSGCHVIHAGTCLDAEGQCCVNGGRVLGVVGVACSLSEAIASAYQGVACVSFEGEYYRTDIGAKASSL